MNLDALMADLVSDEGYVSGRRRYLRTVTEDDAIGITRHLQTEVDRGTAAREEVARRQGVTMACRRGCNGCCAELILVRQPEALAVARWLQKEENADVRRAFLDAYPRWREAVGDAPERLADLFAVGDQDDYTRAHVAEWRKQILCPFNRAGDCSIYPVRPIVCRNAHAIETDARCYPDRSDGKPATRLSFVPLDEFIDRARRVLMATHHAVGGATRRLVALADAVHGMLATSPEPR